MRTGLTFPAKLGLIVLPTYQDVHSKGHDDHSYEQVSDCKRYDKVVGDRVQRSLPTHGQNDEHVAEQRQEGEQDQQQRPIVVLN